MKKLAKYLKGYLTESILGPLFKLCEATLELIVPLIIAAVIDNGIATGDKPYIVKMCLLLALIGAVGLAFSITAQYFAAKASVGFATRVRGSLFSHLGTLSYSDVDKIGTSTMITRMTQDTAKVQSGLNLALRLLLRSPFVVFGAMIMAFTIDTTSALTFVGVIPVLSLIIYGIMFITVPMYKRVQVSTDRVLLKTRENLSGARVVRAFGKEEYEIDAFKRENDILTTVQKRVGYVSALLNPLTYVVINVAILVLIYLGAIEVNAGDLTQGEVVALYNYMSQILIELIKLANLIVTIAKAVASAGRISDIFDMKPSVSYGECDLADDNEVAISLSSASMRYVNAGGNSISDISFEVRRGQTLGIIGGTGSGKTTLVNMIPGFYRPTEGKVSLFGKDISEYSKAGIQSIVGIVPQRAVLFKGTVRDNMRVANENATDAEINEALKIAQADGVVSDKGGLDAIIEQDGRNLSGGQKQRLTIARALVKKPRILILDDSASALDFATDAALRKAIREEVGDTTVVIVSQRASTIMHADKIVVLDEGVAVGIGTHDELLSSCEVYREIYDSQFKKEGAI
ncbi:MAG: ABC transporter ATP-binding protein [Clostridia bacterium]|nr:ABC transporter ATP-binding protein [Clostridia bacterium]